MKAFFKIAVISTIFLFIAYDIHAKQIVEKIMLSQQIERLAVLDPVISGDNLSKGLAMGVQEIISSCLVNNAENYSIVERSLLGKVMSEAQFSNTDAVDENQAIELGKLAGASKVILTVISRFEERCMISIKLIDVSTAKINSQISKLVDYEVVLDAAYPMTLAIIGKGDGNIEHLVRQRKSTKPELASGNLDSHQNITESEQTISSKLCVSGLTYDPCKYDITPQPDYFFGTANSFKQNTMFNVILDFSDAKVQGVNLLDFIASRGELNNKFYLKMNEETDRFVIGLNDKSKGYNWGYNQYAPITLVVKVRTIDSKGKNNTSDYVFVDTTTGNILAGIRMSSKGGKFGSFPNLLGDALEEDAAPKLIKYLKKAGK